MKTANTGADLVTLFKRIIVVIAFMMTATSAFSTDQKNVPLLYPQDKAIVGSNVNIVLDPNELMDFQVSVNGTEHPPVDASSGVHAFQGVPLEPGKNKIIINSILRENDKENKKFSVLASRSIEVFNRDGAFFPPPSEFSSDPFHTRDRESLCGNCHRMDATAEDRGNSKPADVLCYSCHRQIPQGKHIHGPAAVWNCLGCHEADIYPAKYSFALVGASEPSGGSSPEPKANRALTVKETCLKCHGGIDSGKFRHGPVEAGHCTLCHDPHASRYPAWLRKSSWDTCTTCHPEQGSGVHVVAGFATGKTHPTKRKKDPSRPGERFSCASCHEPHSAEHQYLYAFGSKSRTEMCAKCHGKK